MEAARKNVIHLRWVKGHCGIFGNERADVLAKEGALDPLREAAQIPKLPPCVIKFLHREGLERRWIENWQSRTDCRQTKQWFSTICKKALFKLLRESGRNVVKWYSCCRGVAADWEEAAGLGAATSEPGNSSKQFGERQQASRGAAASQGAAAGRGTSLVLSACIEHTSVFTKSFF